MNDITLPCLQVFFRAKQILYNARSPTSEGPQVLLRKYTLADCEVLWRTNCRAVETLPFIVLLQR